MLDEMERSVHDALCVVKRVLESKSVVPGGGAVETALSIHLENFATSLVCVEQIFCLRWLLFYYNQAWSFFIHFKPFKNSCSQDSREQLAIAEFARALLVIPRTLAVNAAKDATELVAKLRAFHNTSQVDSTQSHLKWSAFYFYKRVPIINID